MPLPGWEAQKKMINYDRPRPENIDEVDPNARLGAVLILIYPKENALHLVLILRNVYKGTHSGQISFPGGKQEPEDGSLWHTALREANEEVGIDPEKIKYIGALTKVYIPPSRFLVSPFVAISEEQPRFTADPIEVQRIIEAPISLFQDENNRLEKNLFVKALNAEMPIKYFDLEGEVLWGATAMMISELVDVFES